MKPGAWKRWLPSGRWLVIAVPFLWLVLFFAIPFLIVLKISFSHLAIAMPPYTPILEYVDNALHLRLNLGNYTALFSDAQYGLAYLSSIRIAAARPASSIVFFMVLGLRQRVSSSQFFGVAVRSILDSLEVAPAAACWASLSASACILVATAFCCAINRPRICKS